jgi:hypothetical protein
MCSIWGLGDGDWTRMQPLHQVVLEAARSHKNVIITAGCLSLLQVRSFIGKEKAIALLP